MISSLLGERLLLTLWVGSLLAIGYIAVPMAFANLGDVTLAGNYAGHLFSAVNILGLGCGSILLITKIVIYGKQTTGLWRFWVVLAMVILTLIFNFYLQPELEVVKHIIQMGDNSVVGQFDLLHSVSKNLYIILSLLGLALVVSSDKQSNEIRT
ncbi:MAG: DUF4149 domain-containing protein [Pseudomonadota bacterium]|nr:DUF4149 domain-containing protein [Pseudomonadota bacterium]MDO7667897.1 DUF4149 domain-containing protein [Pseudomonadota bacterium]MDO7711855.1 DUF4149 domain-containing protein [Pseudomonadota bacterium]